MRDSNPQTQPASGCWDQLANPLQLINYSTFRYVCVSLGYWQRHKLKKVQGKCEVVPVHTMKPYTGTTGAPTAPALLKLGNGVEWLTSHPGHFTDGK